MKQIRLLAQYYVDLMMKLGLSLIHISEPTRPSP